MSNKVVVMGSCRAEPSPLERLTLRDGVPCIRDTKVTIWSVLELLGHGMTEAKVLALVPKMEPGDFRLVFEAAAKIGYVGTTDYIKAFWLSQAEQPQKE